MFLPETALAYIILLAGEISLRSKPSSASAISVQVSFSAEAEGNLMFVQLLLPTTQIGLLSAYMQWRSNTKLYSPIMVETQNTTIINREIKYDNTV